MGKKSKSKAGGDIWDDDPELADQPEAEEFGVDASPAPQNQVEEEPEDGLLAALQRSKMKKGKRDEEAEVAAEAAKNEGTVQVKSKKEKEREKKEREKAKKKAAAARKAASQPQKPKAEPDVSESASPEPEDDDSNAANSALAENTEDSAASKAATAAAAKGKGKGKKLNPMLAALQKKQAEKEAAERAKAEKAAAAARADEERARRALEEEAAEEEARRVKRERKKQRDEQLKKEGKYMTKRQKEQAAQLARRREQMLASGALVGGVLQKNKKDNDESPTATPEAPKKNLDNEKKPISKPQSQEKPVSKPASKTETANASTKAETASKPQETKKADASEPQDDEDDALLSDWEAGLSDSDSNEKESNDKQSTEEPTTPESDAESAGLKQNGKGGVEASKDDRPNELLNHKSDAKKRAELESKRDARHKKAVAEASESNLRSPICAILGHVDTGKTKLLDNMRKTNVQAGEAGGITQQIGATYFPIDMIKKKTETMENHVKPQYNVPGLLIIDTPGHESFTNLRSRGSSLCNIAILVVDVTHGLEPQTLESIRLLRDRKTPFVVALNKVDRIYGWQSTPNNNFRDALAGQDEATQRRFEDRLEITKVLLAEQGFNSEVYYKNKNMSRYVSIVPTSAVSGEGVPDLLYLLLELTQSRMSKQLMYLSELEATILEVKVVEGLGTTIDVVLSNGVLYEGDRIVLCGNNGPIATNVRALLTPQPARELRIKSQYVHHKEVKAALGVKISANDLEHAIAGSRLLRVGPNDNEEDLKDDVMDDMSGLLDSVDKSGEGVCVQASTLGSLEALLDFLKDMKIPVMSIGLGPVFKRDVMRATTMLDRKRELAIMLCFDVRVDKEAEHYANEQGIKIFTADIIYHLFDEFTKYQQQLLEQRRRDTIHDAVFPCVLKTIQVINKRNPMIIGVDVVEGSARIGTPIVIVKADPTTGQKLTYPLGRIQSMEVDHKPKDVVRKGQSNAGVAVRLDAGNMTHMPTWGRQIEEKDPMYSLVTRKSIDVLKDPAFRSDVAREDWLLLKKLKPIFDIK